MSMKSVSFWGRNGTAQAHAGAEFNNLNKSAEIVICVGLGNHTSFQILNQFTLHHHMNPRITELAGEIHQKSKPFGHADLVKSVANWNHYQTQHIS